MFLLERIEFLLKGDGILLVGSQLAFKLVNLELLLAGKLGLMFELLLKLSNEMMGFGEFVIFLSDKSLEFCEFPVIGNLFFSFLCYLCGLNAFELLEFLI